MHCSGLSWMPPDATTTGAGTTGRMQRFVTALLTAEGALIEPVESDALEVLSPPNVQTALNLREVDRLGFGATPSPGVRRVGLEGDWLDRFGRLLGERGRSTRRVLAGEPRRPGSPERMLEQQLVLDNATYRLLDVAPAWTRYLVLDFRFSATSDEKRDGLLRLGINLATGALPDTVLERVLPELDAQATDPELPHDAVLPPSWDASRLQDLVARAVPSRLDVALASFVKGLRRRFERDRQRLYSYHNELYREASGRTAGLPAEDPARKRDALRAEAAGRGVPGHAGRLDPPIRDKRRGGMGANAGVGHAGAAHGRADSPAQGRAARALGLEPLGTPAGKPGLRSHRRHGTPQARLRRGAASRVNRWLGPLPYLRQAVLPRMPLHRSLPEMRDPCHAQNCAGPLIDLLSRRG